MTTFGVFFNVFCLFSLSPVAFKSGCTSEYLNYPRDLFFKKLCLGPILSTFNQNLWGREWGNSGINNFNNFLINVSRDSNMYPQLTIAALGQSFSNFHMHTNHLGGLAKMQILPQWVWLELKTAFLTSFPVLLLLVHGPTLNGEDLSHSYPTPSQVHSRRLADAASLPMPKQICKLPFSRQYLNFTFKCLGCNFCRK